MLGLGRLEGRMEQFLAHQTRHEDRLNEHDGRITVLESNRTSAKAWIAGAAAAATGASTLLAWALSHLNIFK